MYPNLGSGNTQPSAPPPSAPRKASLSLANSTTGNLIGFSSLISQLSTHNAPYPGGVASPLPYPTGPPTSYPSHTSPYPTNNQPSNTNNFSPYTASTFDRQPPPSLPSQGNSGYQQSPYPPSSIGGQRPPPPQSSANMSNYQSPYPPSSANMTNYPNPYPLQQGVFPQNNFRQQQQQQQSFQNPYGSSATQQPQNAYPQYNQQAYGNGGGGHNVNSYGDAPTNFISDRLRAIAGKYEISDALLQRLNILQQFEIVILCDDSGSMNTPVSGTMGTRWDELRTIVQIVMEIGIVFDANGIDLHFLNRPPILNVSDSRQVIESFSQRPQGLTPLTSSLRKIFRSGASKPDNNKHLLVFIATDGAPTDSLGNIDIQSLENLMRNERQATTTHVTFLACTDDDSSVAYLSEWDQSMLNVDVVDDYKTEREEVRRARGKNYPFSFGDYVVKALLGAVDPQMDALDEYGGNR